MSEEFELDEITEIFLEETQLKRTRPMHQSMQVSDPSGYGDLMGHIFFEYL